MTAYQDLTEIREALMNVSTSDWLTNSLWTWQWWLLLISSIIPWMLWWRFADKERGRELIIVGLICMVITNALDHLGTFYNLWGYPIRLTPIHTQILPGNSSVFPVTLMFMCQFYAKWSKFFVATVVVSAFFSYVVEPLFQHFNIYQDQAPWNHSFSFIGFIITIPVIRFTAYKLLERLK